MIYFGHLLQQEVENALVEGLSLMTSLESVPKIEQFHIPAFAWQPVGQPSVFHQISGVATRMSRPERPRINGDRINGL